MEAVVRELAGWDVVRRSPTSAPSASRVSDHGRKLHPALGDLVVAMQERRLPLLLELASWT
ncbi:MAG: hypothetical protein M3304_08650 [Actinomycetota bacterium]|nr:hypothetical protein [Actinomycetota bacterium]